MTRVAIAGAAHPHVEYAVEEFARSAELDLVAVSDPSPTVAEKWAGPFGARVFADHRHMLAEMTPDIVVVAGIYGDRGGVIVDALLAGSDVVADKPLCTTLEELKQIEEASRHSDRSVTLLLEKRYYPETIAAVDLVSAGELGALVGIVSSGPHKLNRATRPDWFFERAQYGGILGDLAVHDIDAALSFLTGTPTGSVRGVVAGSLAGAPDFSLYGVATLVTPDCVITAEVNWMTPAASPLHGDYQMRLVGTEGTAEIFWARRRLVVTTNSEPPREIALPTGFRPAERPLRALANGARPDITTEQSLLATRLALLAQRSADGNEAAIRWSANVPTDRT